MKYNKFRNIIIILIGIVIRIFMLIFYYYSYAIDPTKSWGDVQHNYDHALSNAPIYPPLTMLLLMFFRFISFESIEVFAFWAFSMDIIIMLLFYFVLKNFNILNEYVYGLFLINPFLFLNNVFSLDNCGYHITDSFFFLFLFLTLIFYNHKNNHQSNKFYLFLGLSMVTKIYTLPIIIFLFLRFVINKNWNELKKFSFIILIFTIFFILPIICIPEYFNMCLYWISGGDYGTSIPLYIKLIPIGVIMLYGLYRLKKVDIFELMIISIIAMASFMFFSNPFIRYFQSLIFYGILKQKIFFTIKINLKFIKKEMIIDNNLVTFYLSILAVLLAWIMIVYVL